jgi:hypothetical protein
MWGGTLAEEREGDQSELRFEASGGSHAPVGSSLDQAPKESLSPGLTGASLPPLASEVRDDPAVSYFTCDDIDERAALRQVGARAGKLHLRVAAGGAGSDVGPVR